MNDILESKSWKVLGASVAGVSHREAGATCQDAYHWKILPDGTLILAVSDGAGSAARSEIGAELAVTEAVEFIANSLNSGLPPDEDVMKASFQLVNVRLQSEAERSGLNIRDLACTLCVVLLTDNLCIQGTIGDSGAILSASDGRVLSLFTPQKGEYVNETCFVTGKNWTADLQVTTMQDKTHAVIVSTDGLMDYLIRGDEPVPHLVTPLFKFIEQSHDSESGQADLRAFIESGSVTSKVYDDITLLLCCRDRESTA